MTERDFAAEYAEAEAQHNAARKDREAAQERMYDADRLMSEIVAAKWAIAPGSIVVDARGKAYSVTSVGGSYGIRERPALYGRPLKNDGTPSLRSASYIGRNWTVRQVGEKEAA